MDEALRSLKKEVTKFRGKGKKAHSDTVARISSRLASLDPVSLSVESLLLQDFVKCCRQSLCSLYPTFTYPALQLAAEAFRVIYHGKVLPSMSGQLNEQKEAWELVLDNMLSGILDFFDSNGNDATKEAIGASIYPPLCEICFSLSATMIGVELRCTAYTLLSDCAASHKANQQRLREPGILGCDRIGNMLWRTKDFLVLESLLTVFARSLPSTNSSSAGRIKRAAYIQSIFVTTQPPEAKSAGTQIADMLEHVSSNDWDETASKIIDVLSDSNIAFPQPFSIEEVIICNQKKSSDRIFVDDKALVANIPLGDDQYESLNVPYLDVKSIKMHRLQGPDQTKFRVDITSTKMPKLGKQQVVDARSQHSMAMISFCIRESDKDRLKHALRSRNLQNRLSGQTIPPKLSVAKSPTYLEFDVQGNPMQEMSQEERIEKVAQFYRTNDSSDDIANCQDAIAKDQDAPADVRVLSDTPKLNAVEGPGRETTSKAITAHTALPGAAQDAASTRKNQVLDSDSKSRKPNVHGDPTTSSRPLKASRSIQQLSDSVFGASDEELSEISDADAAAPAPLRSEAVEEVRGKKTQPQRKSVTKFVVKNRRIVDSDDEPLSSSPSARAKMRQVARKPTRTAPPLVPNRSSNPVTPVRGSIRQIVSDSRRSNDRVTVKDSSTGAAVVTVTTMASSSSSVIAANRTTTVKGPDHSPNPDASCPDATSSAVVDDPALSHKKSRKVIESSRPAVTALDRDAGALASVGTRRGKRHREDVHEDTVSITSVSSPPLKRTRRGANLEDEAGVHPEKTESQVLRPRMTAAIHATKRYRANKGRTSSPIPTSTTAIDYDELPTSAACKIRSEETVQKSSSPLGPSGRVGAMKGKKGKTAALTPGLNRKPKTKPKNDAEKCQTKPKPRPVTKHQPSTTDDNPYLPPPATVALSTHDETDGTINSARHVKNSTTPTVEQDVATRELHVENDEVVRHPRRKVLADRPSLPYDLTASTPAKQVELSPMPQNKPLSEPERTVREKQIENWAAADAVQGVDVQNLDLPVYADPLPYVEDYDGDSTSVPAVEVLQEPEKSRKATPDCPVAPQIVASRKAMQRENSISKLERADKEPVQSRVVPVTIDLTVPSPIKVAREVPVSRDVKATKSPIFATDLVPKATNSDGSKLRNSPTVAFASQDELIQHRRMRPEIITAPSQHSPTRKLEKVPVERSPGRQRLSACTETKGTRYKPNTRAKEADMLEIVAVLDDIHEALKRKIKGRFEGVRTEVRVGRATLMSEAFSTFSDMRAESVKYFNTLIDLEAEYAKFSREMITAYEDVSKAGNETCQELRQAIQDHDRRGLCKKFPASLISALPPAMRKSSK